MKNGIMKNGILSVISVLIIFSVLAFIFGAEKCLKATAVFAVLIFAGWLVNLHHVYDKKKWEEREKEREKENMERKKKEKERIARQPY